MNHDLNLTVGEPLFGLNGPARPESLFLLEDVKYNFYTIDRTRYPFAHIPTVKLLMLSDKTNEGLFF